MKTGTHASCCEAACLSLIANVSRAEAMKHTEVPPLRSARDGRVAGRAQAHQPRRELAEVFDLPGVAVHEPDLRRGDECPLAAAVAVEEDFRIAKLVVRRARAVAQLVEADGTLEEYRQARAALPRRRRDDGVGRDAAAAADADPAGVQL